MKKSFLSLLLATAILVPFGAGAQNGAGDAVRAQIKNARGEAQAEVGDLKKAFEVDREAAIQAMQARREALQQQFQVQNEELKKTIEAKREEIKNRVEARRAELETKIQGIKDVQKKALATRIDANLKDFNSRLLERFAANLDQMSAVLVNITSRTDKADARGLNVSSVRTAIAAAQTAISNARTAISAQAGKTYVPTVAATSTDSMLKSAFVTVRDSLRQDLKVVEKAVKDARDAVHAAAVALAQIPRINETDVTTSTVPAVPSPATSTQ